MGNKGLFHVVAVPRAFFGTFFRFERKYYPSRGGSPTIRAVVGASGPNRGNGYAPAGAPKGFPRGKQSARFALPCAPLVVCLNSGSLTAFGGCIHWIPASLRSPLETFGPEGWQSFPMELQAPPPAPQPARQALGGNLFTAKLAFATACPNETNAAGNKTGTIFYHPQSLPF